MLSLIRGEPVTVVRPAAARDDLGEPVYGEPERTEVPDVLVAPGATSDMGAQRPGGVLSSLTLGFPKTYRKPLRGCKVEVRGRAYEVVGDPQPLTPENVPGAHNYTVEVTRSDG